MKHSLILTIIFRTLAIVAFSGLVTGFIAYRTGALDGKRQIPTVDSVKKRKLVSNDSARPHLDTVVNLSKYRYDFGPSSKSTIILGGIELTERHPETTRVSQAKK